MDCYVCRQSVDRLVLVDDLMCCAECAKIRLLAKLNLPMNPGLDEQSSGWLKALFLPRLCERYTFEWQGRVSEQLPNEWADLEIRRWSNRSRPWP